MIGIIDYGLGNVQAFANIYKHLNIDAKVIDKSSALNEDVSRLILPGVGAFDWAMERLTSSGLRGPLQELVIESGIPVLGVCVGMQLLAESSDEGKLAGLGWIPGQVKQIDVSTLNSKTHLPHMGWNNIKLAKDNPLFKGMGEDKRFYFLHSYHFVASDLSHVLATSTYGQEFHSAVNKENIFGTQFHPEKSHQWGVSLLRNFAQMEN